MRSFTPSSYALLERWKNPTEWEIKGRAIFNEQTRREAKPMRVSTVQPKPRWGKSYGFIFTLCLTGSVFLTMPRLSAACPLVIKSGPRQNYQATLGGYCRIYGIGGLAAAPVNGGEVRRRAFVSNSDGDSITIIDRDNYK